MPVSTLVAQLIDLPTASDQRTLLCQHVPTLTPSEIDELAEQLKAAVLQHANGDAEQALRLATLIGVLGKATGQPRPRAVAAWAEAQALAIGFGRFQAARPLFDAALAGFAQLDDDLSAARVQITHIWALAHTEGYAAAQAAAQAAERVLLRHKRTSSLANLYNNWSAIEQYFGHNDATLALIDKTQAALAEAELLTDGRTANLEIMRQLALGDLGQMQASLAAGERALAAARAADAPATVAQAQHNLGITYRTLGQYHQALHHFEAARTARQQSEPTRTSLLQELASIECFNRLRRFEQVVARCRSLAEQVEAGGEFSAESALARLIEAQAHLELDDLPAAKDALTQAASAAALRPTDPLTIKIALVNAMRLQREGALAAAHAQAVACAAAFDELNLPTEAAWSHLTAAEAALAQGAYADTQTHVEQALRVASAGQVGALLYEGHALLGRCAEAQAHSDRALAHYLQALGAVERLQSGTTVEFRPDFAADRAKQALYSRTVALQLAADRPLDALQTVDRAKSQALLDLIRYRLDLRIRARTPRDQPLVDELNQLQAQRNRLQRQHEHDRSAADAAAIRDVETRITTLWHQLLVRNDAYVSDAELVQGQQHASRPPLAQDAALVEYFVADDGVLAFVTVGAAAAPVVVRLALTAADIGRNLHALRLNFNTVARMPQRAQTFIPHAQAMLHKLYQLLWQPFAAHLCGVRHVTIVPHAQLHYLPFHALHDGNVYLLTHHDISYLPSASLLDVERPPLAQPVKLVGVSHSFFGRLPETRAEVEQIATQWPHELLIETDARVAQVAASTADATILHLAAHGEYRPDNPLFSGIALEDGWLTTMDIFNLPLSATLVTLSACETGRHVLGGGDELLGLMRAFLAAGAASVVLSHWAVDDAATRQLMTAFYARLAQGDTKVGALRHAQRQLWRQADAGLAHPYFWAAFYLVGAAGPILLTGDAGDSAESAPTP